LSRFADSLFRLITQDLIGLIGPFNNTFRQLDKENHIGQWIDQALKNNRG
jgi:hypothetical protein